MTNEAGRDVPVCYALINKHGKMYWNEESCVWSHAGDAECALEEQQLCEPDEQWRVVPLTAPMSESRARELLGAAVQEDGGLRNEDILYWAGKQYVILRGNFTPDELKAIAWWMTHRQA